jgi:hypothetical protein
LYWFGIAPATKWIFHQAGTILKKRIPYQDQAGMKVFKRIQY